MKNKKRIVLDTSTLLSAFLFKNSVPDKALQKAQKGYQIVISEYTATELIGVLNREKFEKYMKKEERIRLVSDFISEAISIHPIISVKNACRDPKDIPFLELANTANADFIISSDSHLLDLHPFHKIQILKPSEFLEIT